MKRKICGKDFPEKKTPSYIVHQTYDIKPLCMLVDKTQDLLNIIKNRFDSPPKSSYTPLASISHDRFQRTVTIIEDNLNHCKAIIENNTLRRK